MKGESLGTPLGVTLVQGEPFEPEPASGNGNGSGKGHGRGHDEHRNHRHWYRRPRWIALMVVLALLVAVGIPFGIAWSNRGAKEASVNDAITKFRKQHGATDAGFLRPAAGVYMFNGTGTEKLSLLSTTQQWGPRIPVTVTTDKNGCWTFRIDFSTNHWQSIDFCRKGRTLQQAGDRTFQSFDFVATTVSDTNDTTCSPPIDRVRIDAKPGAKWKVGCDGRSESRGTKFRAAGTDQFVRLETIMVGKDAVPAYRYRVERTITGSQTGTERYDMWYSVADGMPVRTNRQVVVHSPSPIGTVTYTENGSYTLTALQPKV